MSTTASPNSEAIYRAINIYIDACAHSFFAAWRKHMDLTAFPTLLSILSANNRLRTLKSPCSEMTATSLRPWMSTTSAP